MGQRDVRDCGAALLAKGIRGKEGVLVPPVIIATLPFRRLWAFVSLSIEHLREITTYGPVEGVDVYALMAGSVGDMTDCGCGR